MEWFEHLEARGAGQDDPIFPATQGEIGHVKSADGGVLVGNLFWKNASRCSEGLSEALQGGRFAVLLTRTRSATL